MIAPESSGHSKCTGDTLISVLITVPILNVIPCALRLRRNNIKYTKAGFKTFSLDPEIYHDVFNTGFLLEFFPNMKLNYIYKWGW